MSKIGVHLAFSILGVVFGISGFFAFFVGYHNFTAGTWAPLSGMFAAICLHLQYLVWRRRLDAYHTQESLGDLSGLGLVVGTISCAFCFWYIFETLYWHIPMMPVAESTVISAVWSFMTGKWGFMLFRYSRIYRIKMELGLPLLDEDADDGDGAGGPS